MNIELMIQNNKTGTIYDISELASDITLETWISGQAGKLTFRFIKSDAVPVAFYEGSRVSLKADGEGIFWGYVFTKSRSSDGIITVTAYDQLRYLKNQDTYMFKDMTSSDIAKKICQDFNLKCSIVHPSTYKVGATNHDNKALSAMIQDAFDKTLAYAGKNYMLRDNFGTLEHLDVEQLKTSLIIGDKSLLTDYQYETSIDQDVYNQIKLIQDNKKTNKRDVYIVKDSNTIARWGALQYHEKMDENANAAQIASKAETLLKLYNNVRRKLSLDCLGDFRVKVGAGILVSVEALGELGEHRYCTVSSCKHSIKNNLHMMSLEVEPIWLEKD